MISLVTILTMLLLAVLIAMCRPDYFLPFLLAVGPVGMGFIIGSMNLSALWLLLLICISGYVMLTSQSGRLGGLEPYEKASLVFLGWCLISALWAPSLMFASRGFFKLCFPFLVMLLARGAGESLFHDNPVTLRWALFVGWIAVLWTGGVTNTIAYPVARLGRKIFVSYASFADYTTIITLLAVVAWGFYGKRRYLLLAALAAVSPVVYGIRTGILATVAGLVIFALLYFKLYKALPAVAALYIGLIAAFFFVPVVREHMFFNPDEVSFKETAVSPHKIDLDQIDSSGRFRMWQIVLERFWEPHPLAGSGLGAAQAYFYAGLFGGARVEHSGYVRLLTDTGLIGLCLYLVANLLCMAKAWHVYRHTPNRQAMMYAIFVLCSMPAMMICLAFDNVFDYALQIGQYPYAFIGMMAAVDSRICGQTYSGVLSPEATAFQAITSNLIVRSRS